MGHFFHSQFPPRLSSPTSSPPFISKMAFSMKQAAIARQHVVKAPKSSFSGSAVAVRARSTKSTASRVVLTTAKKSEVAAGYAAALLETAIAKNQLDAINDDVLTLEKVLTEDVVTFLKNPIMPAGQKKAVLAKICAEGSEDSFSQYTSSFLKLLVDKNRISEIKDIIETFDELYCDKTNTQVAVVTSAEKLANEQRFQIAQKIQELTGAKNVKLKPVVDESLLAGFTVKYGEGASQQIDCSMKGKLERIAAELV